MNAGARSTHAALSLMGGFTLSLDGRSTDVPPQSQRLLAYVALQGRTAARDKLCVLLWPDTSEQRAAANLRSALWRVRAVDPQILTASRTNITIGPEVDIDVERVVRQARAIVHGDAPPTEPRLDFDSDLLPGWYDEWVLTEREWLRQLSLHAMEHLSALLAGQGRHAEAIEAALTAIRLDPLRESGWRVLISAHMSEGNWSEARRQYSRLRHLLSTELGLEPTFELSEARQHLRQSHRRGPGTLAAHSA